MKLSVSTKIFLGFAVVIVAFGAACAFTIYRMNALRESVTLIWQEVIPVSGQLKELTRRVRAPEEFLTLKRSTDAQWLQRLLPSLDPFEELALIRARLEVLAASDEVAASDRRAFEGIVDKLEAFETGRALVEAVASEDLPELATGADGAELTSRALFEQLTRRTVKRANEGRLTAGSAEARGMIRALRRINRTIMEASRDLALPIRAMNERAESDEKGATLAVILIASAALLLSLLMLAVSQLTVRPIRRLREGARRIAAGHYDENVRVTSHDEIGQLAAEFNTMAEALRARDAELARQREELLRADRLATIGKLAAQITHEVRNPLSSISLNAEMLEEELDGGDPDEARSLLEAIQGEVQRLKAITEEYLRYARLPRPELAPVDVADVLRQLLTFLTRELAAAGVAWELVDQRGQGWEPVPADADQVRQALLNIARNAVEAMAEQPDERRLVFTVSDAEGQGGVRVTIDDTGPGVDPSVRDRLFEPFVTAKSGGTGLGLALTQQIVTEHGGQVAVESPRPDGARGTRFVLELPGAGRAGAAGRGVSEAA